MKAFDKEFTELQEQFEKYIKKSSIRFPVERVKWNERENLPVGEFYCNGDINNLFKAFMSGYAYGQYVGKIADK